MIIEFKKLSEKAVTPVKSYVTDAGYDMTCSSVTLHDKYVQYNTHIAVNIPKDHVGLLVPRSSVSNLDIMLANSIGIIDTGYQGNIAFRYKRTKTPTAQYTEGDRCGQLVIMPLAVFELQEVDMFLSSSRGDNGFGSSGVF